MATLVRYQYQDPISMERNHVSFSQWLQCWLSRLLCEQVILHAASFQVIDHSLDRNGAELKRHPLELQHTSRKEATKNPQAKDNHSIRSDKSTTPAIQRTSSHPQSLGLIKGILLFERIRDKEWTDITDRSLGWESSVFHSYHMRNG